MNESNYKNQDMVVSNDSVQNTLETNDLAEARSTVPSLTSSVKEEGYSSTFDDAACVKTKDQNHEYRMYKGDKDHRSNDI